MDNQISIGRAVIENTSKHIIVVIVTAFITNYLQEELIHVRTDTLGIFLTIISIFLVTACFANFASNYEITDLSANWMRILSQFASFFFLLVITLLLVTMLIGIGLAWQQFYNITLLFTVAMYLGIVLYDYWDFMRCFARR